MLEANLSVNQKLEY